MCIPRSSERENFSACCATSLVLSPRRHGETCRCWSCGGRIERRDPGDMRELEVLVGLVLAAVILAAAARRVGAPYPVFLALGGAILAFVPGAPTFTVLPELALALFVAPVLLDAAYDASPRDLRDNWAPVTGLVVFAVGLTTISVAVVARMLMPTMPWAPAIALGAVVAPPDAAAATAGLRPFRPPPPLLTILPGGSLLNDAS